MMGIVAWLLGSQLGRKVAIYGAIALAIMAAIWRVFTAGRAKEKAKQTEAALKNLRTRMQTDDEISSLSAADRRERLSKWVSD
jgi:hypothetical protein